MIWLLSTFKFACEKIEIHKTATRWIQPFFIKKPESASLHSRAGLPSKSHKHCKGGRWLDTAKQSTAFGKFTIQAGLLLKWSPKFIVSYRCVTWPTTREYSYVLWNKALCCDLVYDEYVLKAKAFEVLHRSMSFSMSSTGVQVTSNTSWTGASCNVVEKLAAWTYVDREPVQTCEPINHWRNTKDRKMHKTRQQSLMGA